MRTRRRNPSESKYVPSEGKYIVVNATRGRVLDSYGTLDAALEAVSDARDGYGNSAHTYHVLGPSSNKTVAVIDGDSGDVRMNPSGRRRSTRSRRNPNYADVLQTRRELKEKLHGTPLMYSVALERWLGDDEDKEDLVISAVNQMLREGWQKSSLDRSHSLVIARHGTAKPYYSVLLQSSRRNPSKRASLRTREGTRVRFVPSSASLALYGQHPQVGEDGTVRPVSLGSRRATSLRGPGGGLLYVDWDRSAFQGVSPLDLVVVR